MPSSSFNALLALALLASSVSAGTYSGQFVSPAKRNDTVVQRRAADGFVNFGYFANWASNAPLNFKATDIKTDTLTHILYAFVDSDKATGALSLSDAATDTGGNDSGTLGGQLGDLFALKQKARHLKTLFSVGGWTYSQDGHFDFVVDATARAKFVADAIQYIEDFGFDGIDIDYEALTDAQTDGFVSLMKELRAGLDKYAADKGDEPYLLTTAVGQAPGNYVSQTKDYMDFFNIMDYDFSGSWLTATASQSNLFADGTNGGISVDTGMQKWLAVVPGSKLVMGQPLYGRAFASTDGMGQPFTGVGANEGIRYYKDLPITGDNVHEDLTIGSSYSYDPATKELVAYDTPGVTKMKSDYIKHQSLAGAMWWDLSTDKPTAEESLVAITAAALGAMDKSNNHISYPKSKYTNVASAGAGGQTPSGGGEGTSAPAPPADSTSAPAPPSSTAAPPPAQTSCAAKRRV